MGIRPNGEAYAFECDGCDEVLIVNEHSLIDATAEARTNNWGSLHHSGQLKEWYCARCAIQMGAD